MRDSQKGRFITFEGLDGCGKSTQLERLSSVLRNEGVEIVVTREPGGTPIGEKIRAVLLDSKTERLAPLAELALMFASRAQHIEQVIKPALAAGKWVLCDRFTDSSEAYQGGGRQLGSETVLELHRMLCGNLQADLTILMDCDIATSLERARRRNRKKSAEKIAGRDEDRYEQESEFFFTRVRDKFLEIAGREPNRVFIVNAREPADVVHQQIVAAVRVRFQKIPVRL